MFVEEVDPTATAFETGIAHPVELASLRTHALDADGGWRGQFELPSDPDDRIVTATDGAFYRIHADRAVEYYSLRSLF